MQQYVRIYLLQNHWFRASYLYINKIQQDATVCTYVFTAKSLVPCIVTLYE